MNSQDRIAVAVRSACLTAGREAFEDAGLRGLCLEGRVEAAFAAIEALDLDQLVAAVAPAAASDESGMPSETG